jgi:hypothetical protein
MGWWGRFTETLSDLIEGRRRMLPIFRTMQSVYLARVYYLAAELKLADRLRQQPMTVLQLAEATGVQAAMLSRVLRVLAAFKVIREDRHGVFHLRPRGRPLLSDAPASLHEWLLFIGRREVWQGLAMAMESLQTGKSGFELAHGANYYDYLLQHPELQDAFVRAMSKWTDWQAKHIVRAYDFGRFGTVVDVGGGRGSLLLEILAAHPRSRAVLFDQAETIEHARPRLASNGYAKPLPHGFGEFPGERARRRRCVRSETRAARLGRSACADHPLQLPPRDAARSCSLSGGGRGRST